MSKRTDVIEGRLLAHQEALVALAALLEVHNPGIRRLLADTLNALAATASQEPPATAAESGHEQELRRLADLAGNGPRNDLPRPARPSRP